MYLVMIKALILKLLFACWRFVMKFEEHGVFEIKLDDKLLLVDATGPFNEELINRYHASLELCIAALKGSLWHQIIVLHDTSLFTPEAEAELTKSIISRKTNGLTAGAVVIADVNCKMLVKEQMSRCYKRAGIKHEYFNSVGDAKSWLDSLSVMHS